jgi:hypothetical protein
LFYKNFNVDPFDTLEELAREDLINKFPLASEREAICWGIMQQAIQFAEIKNVNSENTLYGHVISLFKEDKHGPCREWAAKAAFNRANDSFELSDPKDPDVYIPVIDQFGKDEHAPCREQAARAAFNRANVRFKLSDPKDPDFYIPVIDQFGKDEYAPCRERAARAAFNRAHDSFELSDPKDPDVYIPVIDQFGKDEHAPCREQAARAAFLRANAIAEMSGELESLEHLIKKLGDDSYPQIQNIVQSASATLAGWLLIAGDKPMCENLAEKVLARGDLSIDNAVVMRIFLFMITPDWENKKALRKVIEATPDDYTFGWTFTEFKYFMTTLKPTVARPMKKVMDYVEGKVDKKTALKSLD